MLVVVVEDVVGAAGTAVVDCSVVLVLVALAELPQPASNVVPPTIAMPITNLRWDFLLVMGKTP